MYYATFKNIGNTDIAVFKTEKERDDWVNFNDPFSKMFGANSENCTFKRMPLTVRQATYRINRNVDTMLHIKDEFNPNQEWYILT